MARYVVRTNPSTKASHGQRLIDELKDWTDGHGIKARGARGPGDRYTVVSPDLCHGHLSRMRKIAEKHGFRVKVVSCDRYELVPRKASARKNPGGYHTAVGRKFDDCVRSVRARGGAYSPEAVCAAALRRAGQGPALQRAAVAGRRRAARARRR